MLSDKIKNIRKDLEKIRNLTVAFLPTTSRQELSEITFRIDSSTNELETVILSLNLALSVMETENKDMKVILAGKGITL